MDEARQEELRDLAELALLNAFWEDFSALANTYLKAAEGLKTSALEQRMGDLTSIYGRRRDAEGDHSLNIWTQGPNGPSDTCGHQTLLGALEHENALSVHLCGRLIFERNGGEWYFLG